MKLAQLRNLVAVAERGSLRSGAEALGVSRQALVRSIRDVEQELGTALFKRDGQSMTPTIVGAAFVRRVAAAQRELDRASQDIAHNPGSSAGLVSIGISASPHASILPKVLTPFQRRFGEVRLRIVEGAFPKVEREVRDGLLDFYVGPIWQHHRAGGLKIDPLYDVAQIVVGRKGHPLVGARSLAELVDARWIAASRSKLDPLFERHALPRPIVIVEAETGLSMLSAAAASDTLLILPESWLSLIERTGLLTPFRLIEPLNSPSICMVTQTQLPLTPAAACLRDLIIEAAADMRPAHTGS